MFLASFFFATEVPAQAAPVEVPRPPPSLPIAALEVACGLADRKVPKNAKSVWSGAASGGRPLFITTAEQEHAKASAPFGGRRFWRPVRGLKLKKIKARQTSELDSQVIFEVSMETLVGQAGPCELVNGTLRLPILQPALPSESNSTFTEETFRRARSDAIGWVTLSAENRGGPRFFEEVPSLEIEARSQAAGHHQCAKSGQSGTSQNQIDDSLDLMATDFVSQIHRLNRSKVLSQVSQNVCAVQDSNQSCHGRIGLPTFVERCARRAFRAATSGDTPTSGARIGVGRGSSTGTLISADIWIALVASLGGYGHEFLGIRQLAALQSWLNAVLPRLPQAFGLVLAGLQEALQNLLDFSTAALTKSLAAAGAVVVCSEDWERAVESVRLETMNLVLLITSSKPLSIDDVHLSSSSWNLLHGLACVANATSSGEDADGLDLLHALWALLTSGSPLAVILGGNTLPGESGNDEVLADAISEGRYGVSEAHAENIGVVLWQLHSAVTAREALLCAGRKPPLDLRWPTSAVCPNCWKRCFRKRRFCWEPWAQQQAIFAAAEAAEALAMSEMRRQSGIAVGAEGSASSIEVPFVFSDGAGGIVNDALPDEDAVHRFLEKRCSDWTAEPSSLVS